MAKNSVILNFFKLYNMVWKVVLPFLKLNKRLHTGFAQRKSSFHHARADIWIQAASAGEAYLAVKIIQTLQPHTKTRILTTSTTRQGMDILQAGTTTHKIHPMVTVTIQWFPFDIPCVIEKTVEKTAPKAMLLIETEIWPALLFYLKKKQVPIYIVNARLSQKSHGRYLKTKWLWQHLNPDKILAVSEQDAHRYRQLFHKTVVETMANIKFETMAQGSPDNSIVRQVQNFLPDGLPLTILASIRKPEEKQVISLIKYIQKKIPDQVIAVFPRHMHRIDAWQKQFTRHGLEYRLKSTISKPVSTPVLILWDRFGELKDIYGLADAVFVGGSLVPLGGQNFLEPALTGARTVTGPHYDDFAWVGEDIFTRQIIWKAANWQAAAQQLVYFLDTPADKKYQGRIARQYIAFHQGGARKVCDQITTVL